MEFACMAYLFTFTTYRNIYLIFLRIWVFPRAWCLQPCIHTDTQIISKHIKAFSIVGRTPYFSFQCCIVFDLISFLEKFRSIQRDNFSFFVLLLLFQNEFHTQIASHARRIIFIMWLTLFIFFSLYFSLFRTFHTISQVQRTNSIQTIMICINNAPICDSAPDNCLTSNQIGLQFKSTMYNENPIIRI